MSDIANELRERSLRAEQEGEPLALLDDAADEIERLRLTDEEREAIERAADVIDSKTCGDPATLRGLLERLK
jgi:cell division septum initiation protein DivIVA